jgi:hypothetical protein
MLGLYSFLPTGELAYMTGLTQATCRRLLKVPQIPSVWEVDRRRIGQSSLNDGEEGDCILWVDGSQGLVRAMDVVQPNAGHEAVVRTMLRAIEYPHDPGNPARPQKVVVRSKELQFYLRSVLQDLGIGLEYVPELPLIEEIFRSFEQATQNRPPMLPTGYGELLPQKAMQLWQVAPWEMLADHEILEITVNQWDLAKVYVSVMGMLGMEFGVLVYRSLDSLKQFRQRMLTDDSMEGMEEAFLGQDCLFLTYESEDGPTAMGPLMRVVPREMQPMFGNLHPLEGMRPFLYEEEAAAFTAILEAMAKFMTTHRKKFETDDFPSVTGKYKVEVPNQPTVTLQVTSLPELADELYAGDEAAGMPSISDDLVPDGALLSLGMISWEQLPMVRSLVKHYQPGHPKESGDGLAVIIIQTSQPKAKAMMKEIEAMGGLSGIGFNPGSDAIMGAIYDIGLLQTENGDLHLFSEYSNNEPVHKNARKKWDQRCKKTKQICGLVIAKGMTGANRGNPTLSDMLALYEVKALSQEDFGIGVLEKQMVMNWDDLGF